MKQEEVDKHVMQMDKLSSIINAMEREIVKLKKQYEVAVEQRNRTGVELVDRNDELCILYEKSNILEETSKRGEAHIRVKQEEIRFLGLKIAEMHRRLSVLEKRVPSMPGLVQKCARPSKLGSRRKWRQQKDCAERARDA